jgi:hypothetical protein
MAFVGHSPGPARRNVGTPVFGGIILASFIGIFAIPPLYVTFQAIREKLRPSARPKNARRKFSQAAPRPKLRRRGRPVPRNERLRSAMQGTCVFRKPRSY